MKHSMSGGEIREEKIIDVAKVQLISEMDKIFWCISDIYDLKVGDNVLVPYGLIFSPHKAKIVEIEKNVNSKNFPFYSVNMCKIIKKC